MVIGETAEIGDRVTLYQGVTLGRHRLRARQAPSDAARTTSRSGPAPSCSARSRSADNAKVGANTVVIEDVPDHTTVVGNPGHPVRVEGRQVEGPDTDWIHLPDPIAEAMKELSARISQVEQRLARLTGEEARRGGRHRAPAEAGTELSGRVAAGREPMLGSWPAAERN